ncbi:MAG: hypothetical protein HY322_03410 [Betaproteobacteria bacterium]|nr:hypothetical protein [Betaproteobacteria bacterium]
MSWVAQSSSDSLATLAARRLLLGLLFSLGAAQGSPGAEPADRQTAGNLTVFLALVPSRRVDDDRHREEVQDMHGRVPAWGKFFSLPAAAPFRIRLDIRRQADGPVIRLVFAPLYSVFNTVLTPKKRV